MGCTIKNELQIYSLARTHKCAIGNKGEKLVYWLEGSQGEVWGCGPICTGRTFATGLKQPRNNSAQALIDFE